MPFLLIIDPYFWGKFRYRLGERFGRWIRHKIFTAIERSTDNEVLHLASERVLRRSRDEWGASPLEAAIAVNRTTLVREFLQRGGMQVGDGSIAHAAMRGNLAVVEMLLAAEKNPNECLSHFDKQYAGFTPLMWATNRKYVAIVQSLLLAGADVDAVAANGFTAVMFTADAQPASLELLDIFCLHKADLTKKDWRGRSIIREARDRANCSEKPEMQQIIARHYPDTDFDSS